MRGICLVTVLLILLGCTRCASNTRASLLDRPLSESELPLLNLSNLQRVDGSFESAKIIFEVCQRGECQYVAAQKRSHRKRAKKNRLLEFPGGRVDAGEPPLKALVRELGEEDDSGVLKQALERELERVTDARYSVETLKDGSSHLLVFLPLSPQDWQRFQAFYASYTGRNKETRQFVLVSAQDLKSRQRDLWTPKSRRLIKGL